ncbi:MAG TPA: Re/Si-specific NAD(P)(+) transhydrogenase subunit alpha [Acidobacteriota bacterium]|jgi:NAD(P) transhydrogenase subunit alpha|nr:Re/Si-specific NAD(P)(+) transhydrogenase subunit alpha [Acidobacteriota bacterium]
MGRWRHYEDATAARLESLVVNLLREENPAIMYDTHGFLFEREKMQRMKDGYPTKIIVGVPKETVPGERRVALVPELVPKLTEAGLEVVVQSGAGAEAGFLDSSYVEKGARVEPDVLDKADILLKVQPPAAHEVEKIKEGATLISFLQPYTNAADIQALAARNVTAFSMELMPRITRAQPMDALSAMSTVSGYKAVLIAANHLSKFFPLLMTAAGTMTPARVFVIGAGVAGLQAIGTAKRLGAVVEAYDTRPVVKEQVESLGAKFADLGLDTKDAQEKTGYAKAQSEEFYKKQQEMMSKYVAAADAVIPTALVPGKRAPVLITEEMVRGMRPGSVIVDLAAEQGGNCALTEPGQEVVRHGVVIIGTLNLPSTVPFHASQMYARTVTNFLTHLLKEGRIHLDLNDELTRGPLATHQGEILHEAVKAAVS